MDNTDSDASSAAHQSQHSGSSQCYWPTLECFPVFLTIEENTWPGNWWSVSSKSPRQYSRYNQWPYARLKLAQASSGKSGPKALLQLHDSAVCWISNSISTLESLKHFDDRYVTRAYTTLTTMITWPKDQKRLGSTDKSTVFWETPMAWLQTWIIMIVA